MSRFLPTASLLLLTPTVLLLNACDTVYSKTYAYQKTQFAVVTTKGGKKVLQKSYVFEPYEQQALARAEVDKEKREVDRLRSMAQSSKPGGAMGGASAGLRMDSGLDSSASSPLGMGSTAPGGAIPGLDAPSMSGSSMSGASMSGAIPGLDTPSMSGASMAPSMSGASMAPSMSGSTMEGASMTAPAAGAAPAGAPKPATTTLPGL